MALSTDVERYEKGKELLAAQSGAESHIDSLSVIIAGLDAMKAEFDANPIFTESDIAEITAVTTSIKDRISTDILGMPE